MSSESRCSDDRLRSIDDYLSASDVFPGWASREASATSSGIGTTRTLPSHHHFKDWPLSTATRPLLEEGADVFIRFNEGLSILKKVVAVESGESGVTVPAGQALRPSWLAPESRSA
jgi:hypothetical protein